MYLATSCSPGGRTYFKEHWILELNHMNYQREILHNLSNQAMIIFKGTYKSFQINSWSSKATCESFQIKPWSFKRAYKHFKINPQSFKRTYISFQIMPWLYSKEHMEAFKAHRDLSKRLAFKEYWPLCPSIQESWGMTNLACCTRLFLATLSWWWLPSFVN